MAEPLRAVPVLCRPRNLDPLERLGEEEEGYRIDLSEDRGLRVHRPRGGLLPNAPAAPRLGRDPVADLQQENRDEGLEIDAYPAPTWEGDRPDWGWILEGFLRR